MEIGLILETPDPVRLILLGRLGVVLPHEDAALIRVRMDAIGVIDFQAGRGLSGRDPVRFQDPDFHPHGGYGPAHFLGDQPNFVLAIGGFNPRYLPPAGVPKLDRLALSLSSGDNPRLRFESYMAITSNTVQFGARLELLCSVAGLEIEGHLGFDALFQFQPFQIVADLSAGVTLRFAGQTILSVALDLTLSGLVRGAFRAMPGSTSFLSAFPSPSTFESDRQNILRFPSPSIFRACSPCTWLISGTGALRFRRASRPL